MKKQFITYEIALKLKELGFDEECFCCYTSKLNDNNFNQLWYSDQIWGDSDFHPDARICRNTDFLNEKSCTAPLWQQAVWFLAEKYSMIVAAANEIERENQILMFIKLANERTL